MYISLIKFRVSLSTFYQISTMRPLTCLLYQKQVVKLIERAGQGKSELNVSEELP